ncbi:MAG: SDR family oxidoreductase [Eubacteriales bacterium]
MKNCYGDVVLVTGASSGIGKATAKKLLELGFIVYGTSRNPSLNNEGIKMLKMDINDEESISSAVDSIISEHGHISILINCAGNGIAGALEDMTLNEISYQMQTNFFGTLNVIRAVLPYMRENGKGLIVNTGSVAGDIAIPYQSIYSASKAALTSVTQSLRLEVKSFGIKCSIIQPGDTKTGFTKSRKFIKNIYTSAYKTEAERAIYSMVRDELNGKPPETVSNTIIKIIKKRNPRAVYTVCFEYKLLVFLKAILPNSVLEFVLNRMYLTKPLPKDAVWPFDIEQKKVNK